MQKKSFTKLPESQRSQNAFKIKKENNQINIEDRKEVRLLFSALLFFLTHTHTHIQGKSFISSSNVHNAALFVYRTYSNNCKLQFYCLDMQYSIPKDH